MSLILILALLQAPDDLATFLAGLDKERAEGAAPVELLKKIDAWAKDRPAETQARLAWNRAFLESIARANQARVEWLTRRLGKPVTLGKTNGTLREVKPDRAILDTPGGPVEFMFSSLAPETGLGDFKKEGLWPPQSFEEAILTFASGKSAPAMRVARSLDNMSGRARALAAFVGWELQSADRGLTEGKIQNVAEELAGAWTKHEDLMEAEMGALHHFVETEFLRRLFQEVDRIGAKDRKGGRKLLDLVPSLTKTRDVLQSLNGRLWTLVERGQWHPIDLEYLPSENAKLAGSKLVLEDKANGKETTSFEIRQLSMPWNEISGFRVRIRPVSVAYLELRFGYGPARYHIIALETKGPTAFYDHADGLDKKGPRGDPKSIGRRPEYEFRVEAMNGDWKLFADSQILNTVKVDSDPSLIPFDYLNGKFELISIDVRKK